jgi:hypothetical protein
MGCSRRIRLRPGCGARLLRLGLRVTLLRLLKLRALRIALLGLLILLRLRVTLLGLLGLRVTLLRLLKLRALRIALLGLLILLRLPIVLHILLRVCVILSATPHWAVSGLHTLRAQRPGRGRILRPPAVVPHIRVSVAHGGILVLLLEGGSAHVLIAIGKTLLGAWIVANATGTTAEGHAAIPVDKASFHAPAVLKNSVDASAVHMHDRSVVEEVVAAPLATGKADAEVAEAVVHAAVVANVLAPVAIMENILAARPSPVGRRPERTFIRRRHPRAGNPVVAE